MASAMGIRTPRVDALTFGLGSGIRGLAGVALSQIDNVSPNSPRLHHRLFMVVVFGGVGKSFGTLVGAPCRSHRQQSSSTLRRRGAGKILVLVFIILFTSAAAPALFALKGRLRRMRGSMITRFLCRAWAATCGLSCCW